MADIQNDIRLAVDSGDVELGYRSVVKSMLSNQAKLVVVASSNREQSLHEVLHLSKIAGTKVITFNGNPMQLGAVCGRPFSVAMLAVINPGNSDILNQQYDQV